jgi:hypothetical protein
MNMSTVIVVLDPQVGENLAHLAEQAPVWIVNTPSNVARVGPLRDRGMNISTFKFDPRSSPEKICADILETIELHHGSYSQDKAFEELRILGCVGTSELNEALAEIGFSAATLKGSELIAKRAE